MFVKYTILAVTILILILSMACLLPVSQTPMPPDTWTDTVHVQHKEFFWVKHENDRVERINVAGKVRFLNDIHNKVHECTLCVDRFGDLHLVNCIEIDGDTYVIHADPESDIKVAQ